MEPTEFARLQAVEAAVRAVRDEPGHITKAEIDRALAAQPAPPSADPVSDTVEGTV